MKKNISFKSFYTSVAQMQWTTWTLSSKEKVKFMSIILVLCCLCLCPLNAIQSLSEQFRILSATLRLLYEGSLVLKLCSYFPWEKMLHPSGKFLKTQETNNSISSGSPWNWADSKGLHFTNKKKHLGLLRDTLSQTELPQRNRNQASGLEKTQINWNAWWRHFPTAWATWWLCKEFQFSSFCEL